MPTRSERLPHMEPSFARSRRPPCRLSIGHEGGEESVGKDGPLWQSGSIWGIIPSHARPSILRFRTTFAQRPPTRRPILPNAHEGCPCSLPSLIRLWGKPSAGLVLGLLQPSSCPGRPLASRVGGTSTSRQDNMRRRSRQIVAGGEMPRQRAILPLPKGFFVHMTFRRLGSGHQSLPKCRARAFWESRSRSRPCKSSNTRSPHCGPSGLFY
ncbi:hypothetical protein B0T14DRAFT_244974 [Immersiella caudata]|uniref:Uncharacterized protein n=1 Tax=Immersiella caudata TaxID=314043 RepID=A0AA39WJ13_9PEZI|nr:hypothetical protein B0T14DRAFT_244974 [Immersiella caudata]